MTDPSEILNIYMCVCIEVPPEPEVPKGPPPPPPPFEYAIDLPPEGAEVPFVRNYVPPPEPAPAAENAPPADGAPQLEKFP